MKKFTFIAVLLISIGSLSAQQNYNMNTINQLVEDLKAEELHVIETALDVVARQESQEFQQLETECKTNWNSIIDNFEAIEGGEEAKKLVVSAFQVLDAEDYMTAIEKMVTRFEAGTIQKSIMLEMLRPTGRMQAFLVDNYDHPRVVAALNKIKVKASDDADLIAEIDAILNGEAKLALDKFRDAHEDTSEGDIPKVLLTE